MQLKGFLTLEEIKDYHEEWENFSGKYILENSYHTHSGMPMISRVFQYKNKPIFRTGIPSKKRLRRIDPYFISEEHIFPAWHIIHYFIVLEQMYHASMRLIRDTDKFRTLEIPLEIKLSTQIFWNDDISIELIWQPKRQTKEYSIEDCFFALYNDKNNQVKNRLSARTFVEPRAYIKSMDKIKEGDKGEIETLIKVIENRAFSQSNLLKPRQNLPNKDLLIEQLRSGQIPEAELHDFFSFWDKTE